MSAANKKGHKLTLRVTDDGMLTYVEPAGAHCAVATCSLPGLSVDALCAEWERRAYTYMDRAERAPARNKDMIRGAMDATMRCIDELRAEVARANQRQPEENNDCAR